MSSGKLSTINITSTKTIQIVDLTGDVEMAVRKSLVSNGLCTVYVPHTTAGITINENADPDVKSDMLRGLKTIVPDNAGYEHMEGNSPAHIKASIMGNSANIIIENNKLVLGTWQGIYFCEFDGPRSRKVYVKIIEG